MPTSDTLLRAVSAILLAAFVVFSLIVTVREIARSDDPLERLAQEQCLTLAAYGDGAPAEATPLSAPPASADELNATGATCIFIAAAARAATPYLTDLFERRTVVPWEPLYLGPRGLLAIRDDTDHLNEARKLAACIRTDQCVDEAGPSPERSLTISLVAGKGKRPVVLSFYDETLAAIQRQAPRLIAEMAAAKKIDPAAHRLEIAFHRRYTRIAEPDEDTVNRLALSRRDGLMIASRGPKIRLLPWEYRTDALRRLSGKGAQYGLDKEEYKKEIAALFIFATDRFTEHDGAIRPVRVEPAATGTETSDDPS